MREANKTKTKKAFIEKERGLKKIHLRRRGQMLRLTSRRCQIQSCLLLCRFQPFESKHLQGTRALQRSHQREGLHNQVPNSADRCSRREYTNQRSDYGLQQEHYAHICGVYSSSGVGEGSKSNGNKIEETRTSRERGEAKEERN